MSKTDNKGFSLVELMIAVCILAIIVIPLLNSFVSSIKVNTRSRQTLRATTLAQNEMEIFQKETIADLSDPEKYAYTESRKDGYHVDAPDSASDNGCYVFSRKGIINDDSGREMFDVYIKLDPQRANNAQRYFDDNTQSLFSVNTIGTNDSATYMQPMRTTNNAVDLDANAYSDFYTNQVDPGKYSQDQFKNLYLKRNINIDITQNEVASNTYTKVKVTYRYECTVPGIVPANKTVYTEEQYIYDNSQLLDEAGNPTELKSIYLFYAPRYGVANADEIVVNNEKGLPVDVYIVRQDILDASGMVEEVPLDYKASLTIRDVVDGEGKTKGRYHTNLNIGSAQEQGKGNPISVKLESVGAGTLYTREQAIATTGLVSLEATEQKDRIYTMTVEVYAAGEDASTGTPIAKLTGTKLE